MKLNFDDYNSLPQQVAENKKNIEQYATNIEQLQNDILELDNTKQDLLTAGKNIKIENNVISADDTDTNVDVKIDNNSIVENKIANIMTIDHDYNANTNPMATKNNLDKLNMLKQNNLTSENAGNNISITTPIDSTEPKISVNGDTVHLITENTLISTLANGVYKGNALNFEITYNSNVQKIYNANINVIVIVVDNFNNLGTKGYFMFTSGDSNSAYNDTIIYGVDNSQPVQIKLHTILTRLNIADNLTTTTLYSVLSANQGVVLKGLVDSKQDILESGNNIKSINGESLLGSGDLAVGGGVETLTNSVFNLSSSTFNESGLYYVVPSDGNINIIAGDDSIYTSAQNGMAIVYKSDTLRLLYFVYSNNGTYYHLSAHYYPVISSGNIDYNVSSIQDKLVSGNNIKTINGESLLGSGDLVVGGGSTLYEHKVTINNLNLADSGGVTYNIRGVFTFINNSSTPMQSATDVVNSVVGQGKIPVNGLVFQMTNTLLGRALYFKIDSNLNATISYISDSTNNITDSTTGQLATMNGNVFDDVRQL